MPNSESADLSFPSDFVWGTATAAYQIEGAVAEGGRGPSIWDTFSHTPGKIRNGDTGDVACDHYHSWRDDIALMRQLNLNAYRFSIAWPRILPTGRGQANRQGLDFYDRVVDGLLAAGITPYATLYHWDLPQALQDEGGWLRRDIVLDFQNYADIVSRALGDRIKFWTTFNEPWTFTWWGHVTGEDAPGLQLGARGGLAATHNVFLSHGAAVPVLRANVPDAQIGIVLDLNCVEPASDKPEDLAAASRFDGCQNRWYLDPLFKGSYPADMLALYGADAPDIAADDLASICTPIDYLGVNFYRRSVMAHGADLPPVNISRVSPPGRYTALGWEVSPHGLYDILSYVNDRYRPPALYVSESGAAFEDRPEPDGAVHDTERADYLRAHFAQARRAIHDGIPLRGYFVWTLMDNFEWAEGYSARFGVVHTDFASQRRTVKDSGRLLADVAGQRRALVAAALINNAGR